MRVFKIAFLFVFISFFANAQTNPTKPDYFGHIEYTKGNFGTYNYPVKGDSILVYLKDSTITFIIFARESNNPRNVDISSMALHRVKKKMYDNIITPDKAESTGNYDMKFVSENSNGYSSWTLYLTHYGDGDTADLTLVCESGGLRVNDLFVATLIKLK